MSDLTRISLGDLDQDAGEVTLPNGTLVRVKQIDGIGYQTLFAIQANRTDPTSVRKLYDAAFNCLRDVVRADVDALNTKQIGAILALASGNVEAVRKFSEEMSAKNGRAPENNGAIPQPKDSSRPIPLDTSSTRSPAKRGKRSAP